MVRGGKEKLRGSEAHCPLAGATGNTNGSAENTAEDGCGEDFLTGPGGNGTSFAEGEDVGAGGRNFLKVVRHEHKRGAVALGGELLDEVEKAPAGERIEAGAGFVENEEGGF